MIWETEVHFDSDTLIGSEHGSEFFADSNMRSDDGHWFPRIGTFRFDLRFDLHSYRKCSVELTAAYCSLLQLELQLITAYCSLNCSLLQLIAAYCSLNTALQLN